MKTSERGNGGNIWKSWHEKSNPQILQRVNIRKVAIMMMMMVTIIIILILLIISISSSSSSIPDSRRKELYSQPFFIDKTFSINVEILLWY